MARFNPCKGREECKELGDRCITCGRSLDEIARTKLLVDEVFGFIQQMGYENGDEFMAYLQRKISKKLKHSAQSA